ncbi:MAG: helix-turn-helix domain-containing protein [Myxococcales bacterium]
MFENTLGFAVAGLDTNDALIIERVCEELGFRKLTTVSLVESLRAGLGPEACAVLFVPDHQLEQALSYAERLEERPRIVLICEGCSARTAFQYAQRGVDALLEKPLDTPQMIKCLDEILLGPSTLQRMAASQLGRYSLKDAQQLVREAMVLEALARTRGNRHAAARLLGVDRRAVQLALKELQAEDSDELCLPVWSSHRPLYAARGARSYAAR